MPEEVPTIIKGGDPVNTPPLSSQAAKNDGKQSEMREINQILDGLPELKKQENPTKPSPLGEPKPIVITEETK